MPKRAARSISVWARQRPRRGRFSIRSEKAPQLGAAPLTSFYRAPQQNYQIAFSSVTTTAITATASGGPTSGQWRMRYREDDTSAWTTRSYQNSASFRITGLKQGTTYEFQASRGTSGNFGPSVPAEQATNTASISTLGRPTTTLHGIRVGGQGDSVHVSCSQVSGATGYDFLYLHVFCHTQRIGKLLQQLRQITFCGWRVYLPKQDAQTTFGAVLRMQAEKGPWSSSSLSVVIDSAPTDPHLPDSATRDV